MDTKSQESAALPKMRTLAKWERDWQKYWSKAGKSAYELPAGGSSDRAFLTETRSVKKELKRLRRINEEFEGAFRRLFATGPAVTVFGSARFKPSHPYYRMAREVGSALAQAGFATLTGGGPGIMEAANRGAHEAGGHSLGLNILLPREQVVNPYVDASIEFHYFFTRKVCLVKYSCAFIVLPGGLGTLDEFFEAATLVQCRKMGPFPVILMGSDFWRGMREWAQEMMKAGVFTRDEIRFGHVTDSPQEAVDFIVRSLPAAVRRRLKETVRSRRDAVAEGAAEAEKNGAGKKTAKVQ